MNNTMTVQLQPLIFAILASGALTAIVSYFLSKRKNSAETEGIVADTYSKVLADVKEELTRYQHMLASANMRISQLELKEALRERRVFQLERAMIEAQIPIPEELPLPSIHQPNFWSTDPEKGEL